MIEPITYMFLATDERSWSYEFLASDAEELEDGYNAALWALANGWRYSAEPGRPYIDPSAFVDPEEILAGRMREIDARLEEKMRGPGVERHAAQWSQNADHQRYKARKALEPKLALHMLMYRSTPTFRPDWVTPLSKRSPGFEGLFESFERVQHVYGGQLDDIRYGEEALAEYVARCRPPMHEYVRLRFAVLTGAPTVSWSAAFMERQVLHLQVGPEGLACG